MQPLSLLRAGGTSSGEANDTRVWLDAQATLSADGKYATVVLRPQAVDYAQPGRQDADVPATAKAMTSQEFKTAVRIPVGKMILIGSVSLGAEEQKAERPQLFLFVQVTTG